MKKKLLSALILTSMTLTIISTMVIRVEAKTYSSSNEVTEASKISFDEQFSSLTLANGYKELSQGNPCMTQKFTADPGVMEYNGRVYVYSSNDEYEYDSTGTVKTNSYSGIKTVNCMSSNDMVNWTDHGTINVAGSSGAAKWASNSWAPAVAHKTINGKEKFFLYFANNASGIGVLTSDSPTGPWTDPIGKPLITKSTTNCAGVTWLFDPAVLVDDDGNGYLYFGGGVLDGQEANPKTSRVVKLGNDMTSLSGNPVTIDAPYIFEDSGINKVGDTYYYSYCTNWSARPNSNVPGIAMIAYMTSKSPMGPFTYQGTILDNPGKFFGVTGNNHHSIIQFKDKSYIFYHSQWLENKMGNTNKGYRNTHVDSIDINNGKISTAKGTLSGVEQITNVNPYVLNRMSNMAWQGGIKITGVGDTQVEMNTGDWIGVSNVDFGTGASYISSKVASKDGAVIKICADNPSNEAIGHINVPATGSNSTFKNVTTNISSIEGIKKLFFVSSGDCAVDNWQFSKDVSTEVTDDNIENSDDAEDIGELKEGWYYIKNVHAQKYLQVNENIGKAGQNVELSKGTGVSGQKWYLTNTDDGYITLKSSLGDYMLDVVYGENKDGSNIQIYNAFSHDAQKFSLKATSKDGVYIITTKSSNGTKALDDYNFGTSDGTNVCQWAYGGYDNQQWVFEPVN